MWFSLNNRRYYFVQLCWFVREKESFAFFHFLFLIIKNSFCNQKKKKKVKYKIHECSF